MSKSSNCLLRHRIELLILRVPVATLTSTSKVKVNNHVLPICCACVVLVDLRIVIIFLYSINLVFVTEMACVYYEVQTESLNTIIIFSYRRGLGSVPRLSKSGLWWTKWHWTRFITSSSVFCLNINHSLHMLHLLLGACVTRSTRWRTWEASKKAMLFRVWGLLDKKYCNNFYSVVEGLNYVVPSGRKINRKRRERVS
jgi:hypothetical protein